MNTDDEWDQIPDDGEPVTYDPSLDSLRAPLRVEQVVEETITPHLDMSGPYLLHVIVRKIVAKEWNPQYDQDRECECGHPYYRHFDTYEEMAPIGCKYCPCFFFVPKV